MRRLALWLSPLCVVIGATGAGAADLNGAGMGPGGADSASISGLAGGAHVGYNFQTQRIVGGVEGDVTFGAIRSGSLGSGEFNQNLMSSLRVKGGYAFGNMLAYGTIGSAWSTTDYSYVGGSSGETVKGLVFGGGAEYAITRNVSLRAELLRYNFGNATYYVPPVAHTLSTSTDVVRVGASIHF
jgi:outer membrane immunogenic protein